jgi:hypothetical protein
MEVSLTHAGAYRGRGLSREELRGSRAQGRQHERGDTLGQHGFSVLKNVTAEYTLTISTTIRSAIGKRCFFCRFDRDIMRDIRPDKEEVSRFEGWQRQTVWSLEIKLKHQHPSMCNHMHNINLPAKDYNRFGADKMARLHDTRKRAPQDYAGGGPLERQRGAP